jgi:hypothetical protein
MTQSTAHATARCRNMRICCRGRVPQHSQLVRRVLWAKPCRAHRRQRVLTAAQ